MDFKKVINQTDMNRHFTSINGDLNRRTVFLLPLEFHYQGYKHFQVVPSKIVAYSILVQGQVVGIPSPSASMHTMSQVGALLSEHIG